MSTQLKNKPVTYLVMSTWGNMWNYVTDVKPYVGLYLSYGISYYKVLDILDNMLYVEYVKDILR